MDFHIFMYVTKRPFRTPTPSKDCKSFNWEDNFQECDVVGLHVSFFYSYYKSYEFTYLSEERFRGSFSLDSNHCCVTLKTS